MTEDEAKPYLKKLGIGSLLDLALIVPKSYSDTRLSKALEACENFVCKVTVISKRKDPKKLIIELFLPAFSQTIQAIFFRYTSYHLKQFSKDAELFVSGKLEFNFGKFTLIQPKIIQETGTIEPKYGLKTLKDTTLRNIMKLYLHTESLIDFGLKKEIAEALREIHFPKQYIKDFEPTQLRALKYTELYNFLKRMQGKKSNFPSTKKLSKTLEPFLLSLPFTLSDDQKQAIEQIQADLQSDRAAKRIIVGDVGCGKSVVAFAAAYIAHPHRSVLMAPTSVLAQQLFVEAKKFLPQLTIKLVTNKSKPKDLDLADLIVGTHALLYDADLPPCDLVMIDEQHRFGTKQRDFLKTRFENDEKHPHFLQFSATPIPRTLAMIESSLVDITTIKQMPLQKDIQTKVISKSDFKDLLYHIQNEIREKRQVAIVYPLVEQSEHFEYQSIEEAKDFWFAKFQNVFVLHGKSKEKESILEQFAKDGDILLSTTVVEVGVSLPRLSTIVIVGAERLGLATLHQLRGRVARNTPKGWCYLYTLEKNSQRLTSFAKLTSGFDVAELDLKFRKSGDLLSGKMQSGASFCFVDMSEDAQLIAEVKEDLGIIEPLTQ